MSKKLKKAKRGLYKRHKYGDLMQDPNTFKITDYYSMNSYVANFFMSGSFFKGVPNNKITMFAGESGAGKTFLALNLVYEALQKGVSVFYFDTESAIDDDMLINFGIYDYWDLNPDSEHENFFTIIRENVVEELIHQVVGTVDELIEDYRKGDWDIEEDKAMFVIDSIGALTSIKEISDAKENKNSVDFTKAKKLTAFFRMITVPLSAIKAPLILTNHVYASMSPYAPPSIKGGNASVYAASNVLAMGKWNHKDEKKNKVGIRINAQPFKNRFVQAKAFDMVIMFAKGMNKYYGLQNFFGPDADNICNFENVGIERGDMKEIVEDVPQFDENGEPILFKSGSNKGKQRTKKEVVRREFVPNGQKSGDFYVKHLGRKVKFPSAEFFSSTVFTDEILRKMDEILAPTIALSKKGDDVNVMDAVNDYIGENTTEETDE